MSQVIFMQCTKCKVEMTKKGVLQSGNSRYEQWQCTKCWAETNRALGPVGGIPKGVFGYGGK